MGLAKMTNDIHPEHDNYLRLSLDEAKREKLLWSAFLGVIPDADDDLLVKLVSIARDTCPNCNRWHATCDCFLVDANEYRYEIGED